MIRLVFNIILATALLWPYNSKAEDEYTIVGNVADIIEMDNQIVFIGENAKVKLSFVNSFTVRVQMTRHGEFPPDDLLPDENGPYGIVNYSWKGADYSLTEKFDSRFEGLVVAIETDSLLIKIRKKPFKLHFYNKNEELLLQEKDGRINAGLGFSESMVYETFKLPEDEHFFGLGGYKNPLDLRGTRTQCYSTELGEENEGGGFPIPWFLSSKGYGIYFYNIDDNVVLDFGTKKGEYSFSGGDGNMPGWSMEYYFIYGPSFSRILNQYTELAGKPILPEKWFFGHIQSRCCDWNQQQVIDAVKEFRDLQIPLDVIIIDYQGLGAEFVSNPEDIAALNITESTPITWDKNLFETPETMFSEMEKLNVKTCISTALFRGIYDWRKYDPTKPGVYNDYWNKLSPVVKQGIDFIWLDNAERYADYSGNEYFQNGYKSHQLFGTLWAKNMVEGLESMGLYGRPVISRAGAIGAHRYAIPWPGDLAHGLDLLSTDLMFLRNGGISGFTNITVDLGGFYYGESPFEENNVIRRMINIIPIVPVSRAHGFEGGALMPSLLNKKQQDLYRNAVNLRYRLHPYIYSAAIEGHLTGRPILAPLVFDYQDDKETYKQDYEFMFGRHFLAAPVMEKDLDNWDVYLPEGKWIHYWSGKSFEGGKMINIPAPMFEKTGLPLFVKEGAIIPMMEEMEYIYERPVELITYDIYPSDSSSYILYDKASAAPSEPLIETTIITEKKENRTIVNIADSRTAIELILHMDNKPGKITANGEKIKKLKKLKDYFDTEKGWYFGSGIFYINEQINTLNIRVPKGNGNYQIEID